MNSYPLFRVGYAEHLSKCFSFLEGFENVISFGRQGGFSYINTDTVMLLGFHAASTVFTAPDSGLSCQEWFSVLSRT